LELRRAVPHPQLLAEYGDIDIALDPFPFTGGLTSCDALWQGVPVLTLPGQRPISRQTLAFLVSLGLQGELAAATPDEYVAMAAGLAADTKRLSALRASIRPRMAGSPLCDPAGLTGELETAYRKLWREWCERCVEPANSPRL